MKFEKIVHSCLSDRTSLSEEGKSASIARRNDETILMFLTDSDVVRRELGIKRACDAVFVYIRQRARPILLFIELKGSDIQGAADQIRFTAEGVRKLVNSDFSTTFPNPDDMRAVVVFSGSAPRSQAEILERFERDTGFTLRLVRETADLRKHLQPKNS
jgi:hypothetical protein